MGLTIQFIYIIIHRVYTFFLSYSHIHIYLLYVCGIERKNNLKWLFISSKMNGCVRVAMLLYMDEHEHSIMLVCACACDATS